MSVQRHVQITLSIKLSTSRKPLLAEVHLMSILVTAALLFLLQQVGINLVLSHTSVFTDCHGSFLKLGYPLQKAC